MTKWMDTAFSAMLVICATTVSGSYVYKTFMPTPQSRAGVPAAATRMINWSDALRLGHTIAGDSTAPNTMVMFGDLECPACGMFNTVLQKVIAAHRRDLRVVYISYPLPYHRFALPAARATECVSRRGPVGRWIDVVYRKQDSLGLKSWDSFANEAQVADTIGLDACAKDSTAVPSIEAGIQLGQQISLRGTPTVVVNGWVYPSTPNQVQLDSAISRNRRRTD